MADYYSILGVTKNASIIEIKTAFRKLAKIYHPDKNPNNTNAKVLFENILIAYDVLSNPDKKRRYDYLNSSSTPVNKSNTTSYSTQSNHKKNWNVSQDDLKQRTYYQNYYKAKQQTNANKQADLNKHTDYKYILFATPLAVGLLLLIISVFAPEPNVKKKANLGEVLQTQLTPLVNGDKPYNSFFGEPKTFDTNFTLKINNSSNFDAVVCLYENETNTFLQQAYLQKDYLIEFSYLPKNGVYWKCMLGQNWNRLNLIYNNVIGGFDSIAQFQNWKNNPVVFTNNESIEIMTLIKNDSKYKTNISNVTDFFEN